MNNGKGVPRARQMPGLRAGYAGDQAAVRPLQDRAVGEFSPCRFCSLEERKQFVETFLRCRGSIKEVEKALGVSYPTVKNMLEARWPRWGWTRPRS